MLGSNKLPRITDFPILVTMVIPIGLYLFTYFCTNIPIRTRGSDGIVIVIGVALLGVYRYANRFNMGLVIVVHYSFFLVSK